MFVHAQSPSRSQSSRRSGFTLIELLVVISIIALLISILLPSLRTAREVAKSSQCSALIKQYGLATVMYANDFDGYTPAAHARWVTPFVETVWFLNEEYAEYLGSSYGYWDNPAVEDQNGWNPNLFCPNAVGALTDQNIYNKASIVFSYGVNNHDWWDNAIALGTWGAPLRGMLRLESIENASDAMRMADNINHLIGGKTEALLSNKQYPKLYGGSPAATYWVSDEWNATHGGWSGLAYRHQNTTANMLFYDGHAENVQIDNVDDDPLSYFTVKFPYFRWE